MNEQSQAHPDWCNRSHSPDGAHSSEPITLDQGEGYTGAVLYLWKPPGSPVMVAAELSGDGDEETMLYLFSVDQGRSLGEAVRQLLGLLEGGG